MTPTNSRAGLVWACAALVVAVSAAWFAWLGWDDEVDVVAFVETGPLEAWQLIGMGVSLVVILAGAQLCLRGHADPTAVAVVTSRSLAWTFCLWMYVYFGRLDDSGFFPVAVALIYCLTAVGCVAVSHAVAHVTHRPIHRLPI